MMPQDQICLHAQRILGDGLPHGLDARAWAREVLEMNPPSGIARLARAVDADWRESLPAVESERFGALNRSELSLGAWGEQ